MCPQPASLESPQIQQIQLLFGRTLRIRLLLTPLGFSTKEDRYPWPELTKIPVCAACSSCIVTSVFRPLLRWVARLRFVIRLQDIVAALPSYAILALLAVPLKSTPWF